MLLWPGGPGRYGNANDALASAVVTIPNNDVKKIFDSNDPNRVGWQASPCQALYASGVRVFFVEVPAGDLPTYAQIVTNKTRVITDWIGTTDSKLGAEGAAGPKYDVYAACETGGGDIVVKQVRL